MFSVKDDNPFIIFQQLQVVAREKNGDRNVIDLSRGDPGYGFTPSIAGREFASYILFLDQVLNIDPSDRFLQYEEKDLAAVQERITQATKQTYQAETAEKLLKQLDRFVDTSMQAAKGEGKSWNAFDVLWRLFVYCPMSGGSYLDPRGQELTRVLVAAWHRSEMHVHITSDDMILTSGVSQGVGTIFKALGEEGCGFLQTGDGVCIASPVYAPYNSMIEERGLTPHTFAMDPLTGAISEEEMHTLREGAEKSKVLFLIDPNNPIGFALREQTITELASIARENDLLVITDEVYYSFFDQKKTMLSLCPERTLCMNARSKIERATGLRFGEMMVLPEGREHIATMVGLEDGDALKKLLIFAKAPGRVGGQFQHTTFVPGPAQLVGLGHLVHGEEERKQYLAGLKQNRDIFCTELGLPHHSNSYYIVFDLNALPGCTTKDMPIEEKLLKLAEAGVVFIPAYMFFSEKDRSKDGVLTSVRASVVNTTPEKIKEATIRIKSIVCS